MVGVEDLPIVAVSGVGTEIWGEVEVAELVVEVADGAVLDAGVREQLERVIDDALVGRGRLIVLEDEETQDELRCPGALARLVDAGQRLEGEGSARVARLVVPPTDSHGGGAG